MGWRTPFFLDAANRGRAAVPFPVKPPSINLKGTTMQTEKVIKLTLDLDEAKILRAALSQYWQASTDEGTTATAERLLETLYRLTA